MRNLPFFQSVATLVGTIIGAGILGLPYVFAQAGFWTGFLVLILVVLAMIAVKLMIGEVVLRTQAQHQISGYIGLYLGEKWKIFSLLISITIYGALLAYFIGVGEALAAVFGGQPLMYSSIFYLIAAFLIWKGISLIKNAEFILAIFVFIIFCLLIVFSQSHMNFANLSGFDFNKILVPFGVILFACSGTLAVPVMRQILKYREYLLKRSILIGILFPAVIYGFFALVVIAVTGTTTTEIATIGLGRKIGPLILIIGNLFAVFTMSTSFLSGGLALREIFRLDFNFKKYWSCLLVVAGPLFLYLLGWRDFIEIIGTIGAVGFSLEGLVYIITYWRARRLGNRFPEYALKKRTAIMASVYLILVFIIGLVYTINTFKY